MYRLSVIIIGLCSFLHVVYSEPEGKEAMWKKVLFDHRVWSGNYMYKNKVHHCSMKVHSIQLGADGGMIASFKDDQAVMDLEGYTVKNNTIKITQTSLYRGSEVFGANDSFEAVLTLRLSYDRWVLSGNITKPANKGLHVLYMDAIGTHNTAQVLDDGKQGHRIGLYVGVPLTLAVILSITAVGLIVWAVKKGHLRQTPSTYKQFNDKNTPVDQPVIRTTNGDDAIALGERASTGHI